MILVKVSTTPEPKEPPTSPKEETEKQNLVIHHEGQTELKIPIHWNVKKASLRTNLHPHKGPTMDKAIFKAVPLFNDETTTNLSGKPDL